jgi:hypothetical protein
MEPTWENVKPLIASQKVDGMMINLEFKASNQEVSLKTIASIEVDQSKMVNSSMKQMGKSTAIRAGGSWLSRLFGGMVGGIGGSAVSVAGGIATDKVADNQYDNDKLMASQMTDENKQAAIVKAFASFQTMYKWENDQWVYIQSEGK